MLVRSFYLRAAPLFRPLRCMRIDFVDAGNAGLILFADRPYRVDFAENENAPLMLRPQN